MNEEPIITVDEEAVFSLMEMGFSENRCKRALMETGNNLENALNYIMSTMEDSSQDAPIVAKKKGKASNGNSIEQLVELVWPDAEMMGIQKKYLYAAAERVTNPQEIINYVFEHQDELDLAILQKEQSTNNFKDSRSRSLTDREVRGAADKDGWGLRSHRLGDSLGTECACRTLHRLLQTGGRMDLLQRFQSVQG